MNRIKKIIFVIVGVISLLLGIIGTVLPILPTVPFLLLASYCFARGSNKFEVWFKSSKIYKKYLENFILNKSMTLKQKIYICLLYTSIFHIRLIECTQVNKQGGHKYECI